MRQPWVVISESRHKHSELYDYSSRCLERVIGCSKKAPIQSPAVSWVEEMKLEVWGGQEDWSTQVIEGKEVQRDRTPEIYRGLLTSLAAHRSEHVSKETMRLGNK